MAEWTDIADAQLEPNAPARSVDAIAFRDNPIAIAEGAPGAPRIQTAGISDSAVTNAKIANSAVTQAKMATNSVGTAQIRTATNSASGSVIAGSRVQVSINDYAFFPTFRGSFVALTLTFSNTSTIGIENSDVSNAQSYTITWRYIAA